jgi:ketosteroid isomerase-like protein
MKADARTEAAVMSSLNRFIEAIASRDTDRVLSCFAPDPDLVLIGSGVDEKRLGLNELKMHFERDWAQSEAISIELGWNSVSAAGSVAWVAGDAIVHAEVSGQEISLLGRFTAVLEQRKGRWLLMQFHFSMPNSEQAEGESFPTK